MNKATLVEALAEGTGHSKAEALRILHTLQDIIITSVAQGEEVRLTGFASFEPMVRAARTMKNPRTQEVVELPETKSVRIRPLKRFKDEVAGA